MPITSQKKCISVREVKKDDAGVSKGSRVQTALGLSAKNFFKSLIPGPNL